MSAGMTKKKGQAEKIKGKAKETIGQVTGNDRMKASGRVDVAEGKARSAVGGAGVKVNKIRKAITGKR